MKREDEIKDEIVERIENFQRRNLFNSYSRQDFDIFCKELERQYNVRIDRTSWKVEEV